MFSRKKGERVNALNLFFYPYIMHSSSLPREGVWEDTVNNRVYPAAMNPNNLGFCLDFDLQMTPDAAYMEAHGKKEGERTVILLGGSAMHGVGGTTNAQTTAGRLQAYLEAKAGVGSYRVINLSMGSWIAFQEAMALDVWGWAFEPDWIVAVDGVNDGAAYCSACAGVGQPMFWPTMLYFLRGQQLRSPFGEMMAEFRGVSGKDEWGEGFILDYDDPDTRFQVKFSCPAAGILDQVRQYVAAHRSMNRKFPTAKMLHMTQPVLSNIFPAYLPAARSSLQAQDLKERVRSQAANWLSQAGEQDFAKASPSLRAQGGDCVVALSSATLCDVIDRVRAQTGRDLYYFNAEQALPENEHRRRYCFIDPVHLSNEGHDVVGRFLADKILAIDGVKEN